MKDTRDELTANEPTMAYLARVENRRDALLPAIEKLERLVKELIDTAKGGAA